MDSSAVFGYLTILIAWGVVMLGLALWSRAAASGLPKYRIAEYVPPEGDVITHGLLTRADRRLIGAAIVGLAVKGRVRVLAPSGDRGPVALEAVLGKGLTTQERMLLDCFRPTRPTPRQQRRYGEGLAEIGIAASSGEQLPDIYFLKGRGADRRYQRRQLAHYFDNARQALKDAGLAKRTQNGFFLGTLSLLFLVSFAVLALLIFGAILNGAWWFVIVAPLFLVGYFFILFLAAPPILRFTDAGKELRTRLSGLREYVRLGEQERLRFTQTPQTALRDPAGTLTPAGRALGLQAVPQARSAAEQFQLDQIILTEELLPYAVLFGQERQWANEFAHFDAAGIRAQNLEAVSTTMEGIVIVMEVLSIIGQVLRVIGAIASFSGRVD
ncbi:DUF2207 family protein [Gulosibacter sp. ACHW.36C]|uniref:DUF2207 domain-containing protein n=1 Tax=Gulosibacter sediminis TaxID=1729695 RepID=A0ABY4MZW5_9MICO|nr:DUF2207 domain-containing protein [Gulosibacter sediminis]UQN15995.1 DUF2207 domain-containing protein [Gulosibacter sediminis]